MASDNYLGKVMGDRDNPDGPRPGNDNFPPSWLAFINDFDGMDGALIRVRKNKKRQPGEPNHYYLFLEQSVEVEKEQRTERRPPRNQPIEGDDIPF